MSFGELPGPTPLVLVAHDATTARAVVVRALSAAGHVVVEATTGAGVVAAARRCRPNVAVVDLAGPVDDGVEVVQRIAALGARVLMCSAGASAADVMRARQAGATEVLTAPLAPAELAARVGRAAQVLMPSLPRALATASTKAWLVKVAPETPSMLTLPAARTCDSSCGTA